VSGKSGRDQKEMSEIVERLIGKSMKAGAEAADALIVEGLSMGASFRMGKLEDVDRSEGHDLGLRVFMGKRQAIASSNDFSDQALDELADRVVAMAKLAPEDPHCGLAPKERLAKAWPDLDLEDGTEPSSQDLADRAAEAEEAGLAVPGITNSEGAGASWGRGRVVLATSDGFVGSYATSSHSVSCSLIAGTGMGMETDYDFSSARHLSDMESAALVGRRAGERTVRLLNPKKVGTQKVPVIYDPRVGQSLLGHLAGAISGPAVARGTSFLKDRMGEAVFGDHISIIDDPHRKRGLSSKPFDGEGVANKAHTLIDKGVLATWLLHTASAHQLGLETTGHAARGTSGPPGVSPTNLYMVAGEVNPEELMGDIKTGLYVTSLIGQGVNGVTGDYSRGAAGFWIENGKLTHPVNELTIAGNLKDMFLNLMPANDLEFRYGVNVPTLRVDGMTVASG
jgi:PmbA protein